ncbi:hypothetical protein [uncultured Dokdonia sp.]|uniref:hypothetical protein n=1 Tax=uncultured Dokdonia sp. TaxID=575653 RepID=UPI00261DE6C0|nr:hypothetical protein [uncultured Dokdonia sp.]
MKKIIDLFVESFSSKLRNPIIVTYIIYWVIYNWKSISYFILSDDDIEDKILIIETSYPFAIWQPLLFAVLFIILINFIMYVVEKTQSFPKLWREQSKANEESKKLDIKEKIALKRVNVDLINRNPDQYIDLVKTNKELIDEVSLLKSKEEKIINLHNTYKDLLKFNDYTIPYFISDEERFSFKKQFLNF